MKESNLFNQNELRVNHSKVEFAKDAGLVEGCIGSVKENSRLGLVVWGRSDPKDVFTAHLTLARYLSGVPLVVFVDDLLPMALLRRSTLEQSQMNQKYEKFFNKRGARVIFGSSIIIEKHPEGIVKATMQLADRLTISEFVRTLPEKKIKKFDELKYSEVIHALSELLIFEDVRDTIDTLLIGRFSQAIVAAHRNIVSDPLSAIVMPKLENEDQIQSYITRLQAISDLK
jgi:hypothetical protein